MPSWNMHEPMFLIIIIWYYCSAMTIFLYVSINYLRESHLERDTSLWYQLGWFYHERVMICGVLLYVSAISVIVRAVTRKERTGGEGDANVCSSQLEVICVCVCVWSELNEQTNDNTDKIDSKENWLVGRVSM